MQWAIFFSDVQCKPSLQTSFFFLKLIFPLRRSCGIIKPPLFTWEGCEGFLTNNLSVFFLVERFVVGVVLLLLLLFCLFLPHQKVNRNHHHHHHHHHRHHHHHHHHHAPHLDVCFCNLWLSCAISTCVFLSSRFWVASVFVDDVDGRDLLSLTLGSPKISTVPKMERKPWTEKKALLAMACFSLTYALQSIQLISRWVYSSIL